MAKGLCDLFNRIFRRRAMDAAIREEIEAHVAMRAELNREAGMSPDEALRAARRLSRRAAGMTHAVDARLSGRTADTVAADRILAAADHAGCGRADRQRSLALRHTRTV